jgi:hypothetical protein
MLLIAPTNSLQHQEAIILLYRPFLGKIDYDNSHFSLLPSTARKRCFDAASRIAVLLSSYRQQYGLKRVHIQMVHVTLTAALIHTYYCSIIIGEDGKNAQEFLLTCIQALGEMGQTYRNASRALEIVTSLRSDWQSKSSSLL